MNITYSVSTTYLAFYWLAAEKTGSTCFWQLLPVVRVITSPDETQLNKTSSEIFRTDRLAKTSTKTCCVEFFSDHIARRDSTQLDKTVLLSRIGSGDVITFTSQLNKTVLLSCVASGDVNAA